jgi:hypothetical protein
MGRSQVQRTSPLRMFEKTVPFRPPEFIAFVCLRSVATFLARCHSSSVTTGG